MMHIKKRILIISNIFFVVIPIIAADLEVHGVLDTIFASGMDGTSEMLEGRVRFVPKIEFFADRFYAVTSINAEYSTINLKKVDFALGEVFAEYGWDHFDFRVGRQIILWGKADGVQITDVICQKNITDFIGMEYKDTRIPTTGLQIRHFGDIYTIEVVWIPVYMPKLLTYDKDNPLTRIMFPNTISIGGASIPVEYNIENKKPSHNIENGEWGLHTSFFLPAIDFSFSLFRGWDHIQNYTVSIIPKSPTNTITDLNFTPSYNRIWMVGMDMAIPAGMFIIRSEVAWIGQPEFNQKPNPTGVRLEKHHQLKALVGLECNPGKGWMINMQYMEDVIFGNMDTVDRSQRLPMMSLNISKSMVRDTLKLSAGLVLGCDAWDSLSFVSLNYKIIDDFAITLGGNLYRKGSKIGKFGKMEKLSNVWLKGKFTF